MIVIGIAMAWAGYTVGLWGYCLVQGYDVPFSAMFHTTWPTDVAGTPSPASGATTAPGTALA